MAKENEIFVHYHAPKVAATNVSADVERQDGKAHLLQADLSTEAGCKELVNAISEKTDKLDVLVNNAGGLIKRQSVREYEWRLMEEILALNTFSVMMVTSLCIPLLEKSNAPCIINISSVAMRHGAPTASIYGVSKVALDSYSRILYLKDAIMSNEWTKHLMIAVINLILWMSYCNTTKLAYLKNWGFVPYDKI